MPKQPTIQALQELLEGAGVKCQLIGCRLYIDETPNGKRARYGFLVDGDDGTTGTCQYINKRKGEIASIIRQAQIS